MSAPTRRRRHVHLTRLLRPTPLLAALALAGVAAPAAAIDVYWDPNLGAPGIGGTGPWDDVQTNWSLFADGIRDLVPVLGIHNGTSWPDGVSSVAVFGGTGGTVTVTGTQTAGGLRFLSDGYSIQGGTLRLVPAATTVPVEVAEGASATLSTTLDLTSPLIQHPGLALTGLGTLVLSPAAPFSAAIDVQKGTLRAGTSGALAAAFVKVSGSNAHFDVGTQRTVALAGLDSLQTPLDLGSTALALTGAGLPGTTSHIEGGISGNRASGIVVGSAGNVPLVIGRTGERASASSFGFLRIAQGATSIVGTDVTLTAATSGTPDGLGALQLDGLGDLSLSAGARLTVTSTASIVGGGEIVVSGGSFLSVIRDTTRPDVPATLAIGTTGGPAGLQVTGAGSTVSVADRIVLGHPATRDAGTGLLVANAGAAIDAPVLSFATAASRLMVNPGGTARFNQLDDGGSGLGIVEMAGGTLVVGDTALASSLVSVDSAFGGTLTGATGTLRKVGAGEFSLTGATNYLGTVRVESGTLRVGPGTLANAVLTLTPGAHLAVSGTSSSAPLRIGAFDGEFDLDQEDLTVEFGGGLHTARWHGRFSSGTVGLARTAGPGIQTFEGGTESAPFTAPFLTVSTGTVRLSQGHFLFTDVAPSLGARPPLSVTTETALLEIAEGARVRAGSGVRLTGGGTLRVTGAGSRLDLQADPATGRSSLLVGPNGSALLEITAGGALTATDLEIGTSLAVSNAEVSVTDGGTLTLNRLNFAGYGGQLTVSGATATIGRLTSVVHEPSMPSVIRLTDTATGIPALTLGDPDAAPGTSSLFRGSIVDGPGGPGSLRKVGPDQITANPRLSGRLIIDGGIFRVEDRVALLDTTVEINRDDGLALANGAAGAFLVGALTGHGRLSFAQGTLVLGLGTGNATFDGALDLAIGLGKSGGNTQTLTGGGRLGSVHVDAGELHLRGGEYATRPGPVGIRVLSSSGETRLRLSDGARLDNAFSGMMLGSEPGGTTTLLLEGPGTRLSTLQLSLFAQHAASLRVENGAALVARGGISAPGGRISILVDRATVETGPMLSAEPQTIFSISDPIAAPGNSSLTRPAAWTVTTAPGEPGYTPVFDYRGSFADGPSGPGSVAFVGRDFRASFFGQLTYTGRTIVDGSGAVLTIRGPIASREFIARNSGLLDLSVPPFAPPWDASNRTFRTEGTGAIRYDGLQMTSGTLRGMGHEIALRGASFDATSLAANSRLTARAGVAWSNASLSGVLDTRADATLDNVIITPSGGVTVSGGAAFTDVENNGVLDLRTGATLTLASPMVSGGGSQVTLASGATLAGETLTLRGALLVNNGTVATPLAVEFGSLAMGAGQFGAVTVNRGGTFSPGNSPGIAHTGSVTFNAGGRYEVEVADALGAPGADFDLWDIAGNLDLNAGATFNSQFVVSLISLDTGFAPGLAANFDKRHSFAWTVLRADSISGFEANELRLDTGAFQNDTDGHFGLRLARVDDRSELQIVYQPVPEPATGLLFVGGLAALLGWRRKRATRVRE